MKLFHTKGSVIGVIEAPESPLFCVAFDLCECRDGHPCEEYQIALRHAIETTWVECENQEKARWILWDDDSVVPPSPRANFEKWMPDQNHTYFGIEVPKGEMVEQQEVDWGLWFPKDDKTLALRYRTVYRFAPDGEKEVNTVYPSNDDSRDKITELMKKTMSIKNWADEIHKAAKQAASLTPNHETYEAGFLAGAVWLQSFPKEPVETQEELWREAMGGGLSEGDINDLMSKYKIERR